jgi:DNA-binding NtrC family response regulator
MVGRVAPTSLPVLITGESGTGKEIVANAIHRRSKRSDGPFVTVNCGAIPMELIESELFGHTKGSFTGAATDRMGLWEEAAGGTLFLDEITETPPQFQVKLLRALQESEIRRVGANKTIHVDSRVICATNRDIEQEVAEGRFRQDLMYRLNAVTIKLPPLRDRVEDIPLLAAHFASRVSSTKAHFSSKASQMLKKYSWPGNVRELENAVLHAVSMADDAIYPEHLPERVRLSASDPLSGVVTENGGVPADAVMATQDLPTLAEMEVRYVTRVLDHTDGNKQAAARILNIDRKTLSRILARGERPSN